jgi:hypothetical protein
MYWFVLPLVVCSLHAFYFVHYCKGEMSRWLSLIVLLPTHPSHSCLRSFKMTFLLVSHRWCDDTR